MADTGLLPDALRHALDLAPEDERTRLETMFIAASEAIFVLGELDLNEFEIDDVDGGADLEAWEQMAPIVGAIITAVNQMLQTIDDQIGEEVTAGVFGTIRKIRVTLSEQVMSFGQTIRDPAVMSNRWNLLDHLAAFRARFRGGIGEMVYLAASVITDVRKDQVVPHYLKDMADAVRERRTLADLSHAVAELDDDSLDANIRAEVVLAYLKQFIGSKVWKVVRAEDKRMFLDSRNRLTMVVDAPDATAEKALEALVAFRWFLDSTHVINQRETLRAHDKGAIHRLRRLIGELDGLLVDIPDAVPEHFGQILAAARTLLGRDAALDVYLRRSTQLDPSALDPADIERSALELRECLDRIDLPE